VLHAALLAEGLHSPRAPAPRAAALLPASLTDPGHHRFPAAQGCSATLLHDGKLQLAFTCCCATPDRSAVMQVEAGSGALHAASPVSPTPGSAQSLPSVPCRASAAADGAISAWGPAARALHRVGREPREGGCTHSAFLDKTNGC